MAKSGQFSIALNTVLGDTKDLEKQIKDLNLRLKKSSTINIKVNGEEAIKQVRTLTDEFGNLYRTSQTFSKSGKLLDNSGIDKVTSSVKVLTTETNKWIDKSGAINTWTTKTDSLGKTITTRVREFRDETGKAIKTTEEWGRTANGTYGKLGDTITETTRDEVKLAKEAENLAKSEKKAEKATKELGNSTQTSAKQVQSLGVRFAEVVKKVALFYTATLPIMAVQTAIQEVIETVKDFDTALTEFKKVSDLSGESLDSYVEKLGELGEAVGRTTTEMVEASTQFKKSSYDDETSAQLAQIASLYQNIADEELSASDASTVLISQMKAFQEQQAEMEATDEDFATHIIDSINEV